MRHHRLSFAALALALLVLAGCEQTTSTFVINADGSGKVLYTATFPLDVEPKDNQAPPKSDDQKVAEAKNKILSKSTGVEAWKDVRCIATPDGLIAFQGTAYVRDFTSLKFSTLRSGGGEGDSPELVFTKIPGGYHVNLNKNSDKKKSTPKPASQHSVARTKTNWKYMRPLVSGVLENDLRTYTFVTPKPASAIHGFQKTKDGYSFTYDGAKILKAMDTIMARPDAELAALAATGDLMDDDRLMKEAMKSLGWDPVAGASIDLAPATAQFDYVKEVASATKSDAPEAPRAAEHEGKKTPSPDGTAAKASAGARIEAINQSFPDPQNPSNRPVTAQIRVVASFTKPVTSVGEVKVTSLTDGKGKPMSEKVAPTKASLDRSGTNATFTVEVPATSTTVGAMSGTLMASAGSGSKIVDLGIKSVTKGAKGTSLNAEIEDLDDGWLHLKFKGKMAMVKAVLVFTKEGKPFPVADFQLTEDEEFCSKTLRSRTDDETWPKDLTFKAEFFTESKAIATSWSVPQFSLPQVSK